MSIICPISTETLLKMETPYDNERPETTTCLVFRTSLQNKNDVAEISETISNLPGIRGWNVDLEDWEKVLRIECSSEITPEGVIEILRKEGVSARELPK